MPEVSDEVFEKAVQIMFEYGAVNIDSYERNKELFLEEFNYFKLMVKQSRWQDIYERCIPSHSMLIRYLFCVYFGVPRFVKSSLRPWVIRKVLSLHFPDLCISYRPRRCLNTTKTISN